MGNVNVHLVGGGHKIMRPEQSLEHRGMKKDDPLDTGKNQEERNQAFHWITRLIATGRTDPAHRAVPTSIPSVAGAGAGPGGFGFDPARPAKKQRRGSAGK